MKTEEQTQVPEILDNDYISVNICVTLLTKFNNYLCVYMDLHLKTLTLKVCVDISKVMQVPFHFPDSGSTSPQTMPCLYFPQMYSRTYTLFFMVLIRPSFNPLTTELNPICHLLALLEAHHILHVSRIRVKDSQVHVVSISGSQKRRDHP